MKEREPIDSSSKSQSILMQVMDKGRFQKLTATLSLSAGQSIELRCKGSNVTWSYPSYLDTFKDSRLRYFSVFWGRKSDQGVSCSGYLSISIFQSSSFCDVHHARVLLHVNWISFRLI